MASSDISFAEAVTRAAEAFVAAWKASGGIIGDASTAFTEALIRNAADSSHRANLLAFVEYVGVTGAASELDGEDTFQALRADAMASGHPNRWKVLMCARVAYVDLYGAATGINARLPYEPAGWERLDAIAADIFGED